VPTLTIYEPKPEWGKANDKRGVKYTDWAAKFAERFPVGSILTADELDVWLEEQGLLTRPPEGAPKDSDAWLGHLQRRHIHRGKLNKASTHPRLLEQGVTPFSLDAVGGGFEVRAPHSSAARMEIHSRLQSLVGTKRKQLKYLMQSTYWEALPPYVRDYTENLHDEIEMFSENIRNMVGQLESRFVKAERRIEQYIPATNLLPPARQSEQDRD